MSQVAGTRNLHNNHPQVKHQHHYHYQLSITTSRGLSLLLVLVVVVAPSGCCGGDGHLLYTLLLLCAAASLENKQPGTRY